MEIPFGFVCLILGWLIASETRDKGDFRKMLPFFFSLMLILLGAGLFSAGGIHYARECLTNGRPLTNENLAINQTYELVADMGSVSTAAEYPKRVLLKKEGEQDVLYYNLSSYLPKDSKYFVVKRYEGEKEIRLVACEKPAEKE